MSCINLKSMYNDPAQMREALAWRLLRDAGVPAARHTYAKLAFDATYYGLFSVIEQVDKRFLTDHFGDHRTYTTLPASAIPAAPGWISRSTGRTRAWRA